MKNNIYYFCLLMGVLLTCFSCQDQEDLLFEKSVEERIAEKESEYKNVLLSNGGKWFTYYGNATIIMTFNADNTVSFESNYLNGTADRTITYDVGTSQTTKLLFESHSVFHEIYESDLGAYDFEFLFEEVTESKIELVSRSDLGPNKGHITFYPAIGDELERVSMMQSQFNTLSYFNSIEGLGKNASFIFAGGKAYVKDEEDDKFITDSYDVSVTTYGFILSPAIEINNNELSNFVFDAEKKQFEAVDGSSSIIIKNQDEFRVAEEGVFDRFMTLSMPKIGIYSPRLSSINTHLQELIPTDPPLDSDIDFLFDWGGYIFFNLNSRGEGYYQEITMLTSILFTKKENTETLLVDSSSMGMIPSTYFDAETFFANKGVTMFLDYFLNSNGLFIEEIEEDTFVLVNVDDPTQYTIVY